MPEDVAYPSRTEEQIEADTLGGSPSEGNGATPVQAVDWRGPQSVVDLFKQEQQELANAKDVYIPVAGYERTGLQVHYRMPSDGKELETVGTKVGKQYKDAYSRNLYMAIDLMILLCLGLYVQPEDVPEPVMLDPDETGEPCQFDETLAGIMGMKYEDEPTARDVVKHLFGGNQLAVIGHAEKLQRWLQNAKADLNAEIWQLGE